MIDYSLQDILVLYFYTKQYEIKSFTRVLLHSLVNGHQVEALGDKGQTGQIINKHDKKCTQTDSLEKEERVAWSERMRRFEFWLLTEFRVSEARNVNTTILSWCSECSFLLISNVKFP